MKVKEILSLLVDCDSEAEVFMYEYDRGDTKEIAAVKTIERKTMPYDRNYLVEPYVEKHGKAVLISDYWVDREFEEEEE